MAPDSRAIIYDALAVGRVGRGERWLFNEIKSETVIMRGARPIYINRARITPHTQPLDQLGWMEGFNYLATLIILTDIIADWTSLSAELDRAIAACPRCWGASAKSLLAAAPCVSSRPPPIASGKLPQPYGASHGDTCLGSRRLACANIN